MCRGFHVCSVDRSVRLADTLQLVRVTETQTRQPVQNVSRLASAGTGYPESVERLIAELSRMPGIGKRTAERLAFYLLKSHKDDALKLARAIHDVKTSLRHCSVCFNFTENDPCPLCADARRDPSMEIGRASCRERV